MCSRRRLPSEARVWSARLLQEPEYRLEERLHLRLGLTPLVARHRALDVATAGVEVELLSVHRRRSNAERDLAVAVRRHHTHTTGEEVPLKRLARVQEL